MNLIDNMCYPLRQADRVTCFIKCVIFYIYLNFLSARGINKEA